MARSTTPIPDEHCKCLDKVLADTPAALELAKQCIDCGLDMSAEAEKLTAQADMARKLKATFYPHRP